MMPQKHHRILFLQSSSVFESFGGIEFYQDDLLTIAADLYGRPGVCSLVPLRNPRTKIPQRPYRIEGVRFTQLPFLNRLQNRFSLPMFRRAAALCDEIHPTVILVGHSSLAPFAWLLSKWKRIPYVVVAYGIEVWGPRSPFEEMALKASTAILSISFWTRHILAERMGGKSIPVFHPHLPKAYEKLTKPTHLRAPTGPFTLLTISRLDALERYKGHDHVLQALFRIRKSHPELEIRYIIQGEGTDKPRLENMAKELHLESIVEFRGGVKERSEFEVAYRGADVFIMPSRFGYWDKSWRGEGFGIVYLEAAAFGVPSIAYNCGGVTDIIHDGENGVLVEPDNIAALADAIVRLASDRELVFKLGQGAHETTMTKFTQSAVREELIHALDKL